MRIILASGSPRRKELLAEVVERYEIIPSKFDEGELKNEIKDPEELVEILSYEKAKDVLMEISTDKESEDFVIIAADTIVYFDGKVLGKPADEKDAFRMLKALQGNDNYVYTGMTVIIKKDNEIIKDTVNTKTTVTMKEMSDQDILDYIGTKDPLDKAGAYAIQGIGSRNIKGFDGSYNSVVGLDIDKLKEILKKNSVI